MQRHDDSGTERGRLPNELAMDYVAKSRRGGFDKTLAGRDPVTLARWGRGASYHEIDQVMDST